MRRWLPIDMCVCCWCCTFTEDLLHSAALISLDITQRLQGDNMSVASIGVKNALLRCCWIRALNYSTRSANKVFDRNAKRLQKEFSFRSPETATTFEYIRNEVWILYQRINPVRYMYHLFHTDFISNCWQNRRCQPKFSFGIWSRMWPWLHFLAANWRGIYCGFYMTSWHQDIGYCTGFNTCHHPRRYQQQLPS